MHEKRGVGRFDAMRSAEEEYGMRGLEESGEIRPDAECERGIRDAREEVSGEIRPDAECGRGIRDAREEVSGEIRPDAERGMRDTTEGAVAAPLAARLLSIFPCSCSALRIGANLPTHFLSRIPHSVFIRPFPATSRECTPRFPAPRWAAPAPWRGREGSAVSPDPRAVRARSNPASPPKAPAEAGGRRRPPVPAPPRELSDDPSPPPAADR